MRKLRDVLLLLGILLFVAIFGFALYKLITIYAEYQQGEEAYEELEDFVEQPQDTTEDSDGQTEKEPDKEKFQVDFDGLKAVNPDVVASSYRGLISAIQWSRERTMRIIFIICLPGRRTAAGASL